MTDTPVGGLFQLPPDDQSSETSGTLFGGVDIIRLTQEYRKQAEVAKKEREAQTRQNVLLYNGMQDWSHKTKGQSTSFLPMLSIAVEQITTFVKRALVDYGDWFSVETGENAVISGEQIREILQSQLNSLYEIRGSGGNFPVVLADAIKVGILHSLIVLKVYGAYKYRPQFVVKTDEERVPIVNRELVIPSYRVERELKREWHLRIDVVNPFDYYPDPTGRHLFEIHRTRKDLYEIRALAEGDQAIYDKDVVDQLVADCEEQHRRAVEAALQNQLPAPPPDFRKEVTLDEVWGTILDENGHVVAENMVWVVANNRFVIRKPEPNPWWHGMSPFVVAPLIRVPFSTWHRGLADLAAPLNIASNELFSLMLDGAFASVHGVKQVRLDFMERPEDLAAGITPGTAIPVKPELPPGVKVIERVDDSGVPSDALAMLSLLDRHFQTTMQVNDIRLGMLPGKSVKATEVVQAEHHLTSFFDGIIRDVETTLIEPLLYKAWAVIAQEMTDLPLRYIRSTETKTALLQLVGLEPEERYTLLMNEIGFSVRGLSGTLQKSKDFQKLMALMSAISTQPLLMQAFFENYSADRIIQLLFKWLNLNPAMVELTAEEKKAKQQRLAELQQMASLVGRKTPSRVEAGGASMEAEINQTSNPLTGLVGGEG